MCGIAGILLSSSARDPGKLRAVGAMTDTLRHRGPDGQGLWNDKDAGVAFGHRRLAIIDLSEAGHQPMRSATGRYVITFNGEIYNFQTLQAELSSCGCQFRGGSDTEVMLAAFETWGIEAALSRFAGMFAFAVWDTKTRKLHLARDRMGKKPLYAALAGKALVFASELRALMAFPDFRPELDREAAAAMLATGWVPDQLCIWRGAFKLAPGSILTVSAEDLAGTPNTAELQERARRWWSLSEAALQAQDNMITGSDEEMISQLDDLLRLAVRQRVIADVPLGAFLSGGVDSSAIVALMQAQSSKPVRTFTIAFGERAFDESTQASQVARHLRTDHTELRLTSADARDVIPELPDVWDEPFADESQIPTLLISRLARKHVTVALTGDGGDECFAGYSRHLASARLASLEKWPLALRTASAAMIGVFASRPAANLFERLPLSDHARLFMRPDRLQKLAHLLGASDGQEMYRRLTAASAARSARWTSPAGPDADKLGDTVSRLLFEDMTGYLPGDVLVKVDRAAMANSLETRSPILDHRVIEFAWRLPLRAKVRRGQGKWILRQVLARYLPPESIKGPKQGFDVPIGAWLRQPLRDWAGGLFADMRQTGDGLVDLKKAEADWQDHLEGRRDHSRELWPILMFQAWRNAKPGSAEAPVRPCRQLMTAGV
jgi:asparagine synthase (glutamine-hydrolysing)